MSKQFEDLRIAHPKFFYQSYSYKTLKNKISAEFKFKIEPDIEFIPKIEIPWDNKTKINENLIFNLGLVESISYWKCTCSPKFYVQCGTLFDTSWWKNLFINGLSEFLFINKINFDPKDFVEFIIESKEEPKNSLIKTKDSSELILVGGGKDSSTTMQVLRDENNKQAVFVLNETESTKRTIKNAGFEKQTLIAKRVIDKKLLELNKQGYLNGHTPFSAYLAFLSCTVAELNGFNEVILSNESSASEPNTENYIIPVNHQYSKSFEFEKSFRSYISNITNVNYYSFLRPILEIQIAKIFSKFPEQLKDFRSCNVGQKDDHWCRNCPKCSFVFLMLSPFVKKETLDEIFGKDFLNKENTINDIIALIDDKKVKPLECIGTREECLFALNQIKEDLPEQLKAYAGNINDLLSSWDENNFLPKDKVNILKSYL